MKKYIPIFFAMLVWSTIQAQTTEVTIPEYIFTEKNLYTIIEDYNKKEYTYAEIHIYENKENSVLFLIELHDKIDYVNSNAYGFVKCKGTICFLYGEKYAIKKKHKKRKFRFFENDNNYIIFDPEYYLFKLHKNSGIIQRVG